MNRTDYSTTNRTPYSSSDTLVPVPPFPAVASIETRKNERDENGARRESVEQGGPKKSGKGRTRPGSLAPPALSQPNPAQAATSELALLSPPQKNKKGLGGAGSVEYGGKGKREKVGVLRRGR